jgi:hypothetical protein
MAVPIHHHARHALWSGSGKATFANLPEKAGKGTLAKKPI